MDIEQKAERARALLSDDLLSSAFTETEQAAIDRLTSCKPSDTEGLQAAAMELQAVRTVVAALRSHIDTHTIEQKKGRHRG
ncbi:hypothetical protein PVV74_17370 [Roseovarius sp. SK2]|uniref:hypothetical protein n=1 Tax=Roseovarius TaxID=74030 RepID=UPI00237BBBCA|nr:hypothetical protein [Roseovarius sp. SK2]MDD9727234.1 hypothetical protein [Roseovarius sp. SK2]